MSFELTDGEWERVAAMPIDELASLAADLDIVLPEQINARTLLDACVPAMLKRVQEQGLPLSRYDHDDIAELSTQDRSTAAKLLKLSPDASVDEIVAAGERAYKHYAHSSLALALPSLLGAVLRAARS